MCKRSHHVCRIGARSQARWILATMEKKVHSLIYPFIHWIKVPYLLKLTQLCKFKYSLLGNSWFFFFLPTFLTKKTLESQNLGERYLRIQNPLQTQYRCRKWGLRRKGRKRNFSMAKDKLARNLKMKHLAYDKENERFLEMGKMSADWKKMTLLD